MGVNEFQLARYAKIPSGVVKRRRRPILITSPKGEGSEGKRGKGKGGREGKGKGGSGKGKGSEGKGGRGLLGYYYWG